VSYKCGNVLLFFFSFSPDKNGVPHQLKTPSHQHEQICGRFGCKYRLLDIVHERGGDQVWKIDCVQAH